MTRVMSGSITTGFFWDCKCQENYIRPKTEKVCKVCGAREEDMPDSHLIEVIGWLALSLPVFKTSKEVEVRAQVLSNMIGSFHDDLIEADMTAWLNVQAIAVNTEPDGNDLRIGLKFG